jgi:hypothetical protein
MTMGQKIKAFLAGMGSVVDLYPALAAKPRPAPPPRNPWAADREAICGDFRHAVDMETATQNERKACS